MGSTLPNEAVLRPLIAYFPYSTPLHRSLAVARDYNVSRILLENGADLCSRNVDGETPLHTFFGPVTEQVLLTHNYLLDCSARDGRGKTLLHHLAWSSKTSRQLFENVSKRSSHALNIVDEAQRSVLHLAAQRGNTALVEYILEHRAFDIDAQDCKGRTPLHYAVESRRAAATIRLLISAGADIGVKDHDGRAALHAAPKVNKEIPVMALLDDRPAIALYKEGLDGHVSTETASESQARDKVPRQDIMSGGSCWGSNPILGCHIEALKIWMGLKSLLRSRQKMRQLYNDTQESLTKQLTRLFEIQPSCSIMEGLSLVLFLWGLWLL